MAMNTATHWGMTINNPSDSDIALLTQYPDHIRKIVYQHEVGAEGTPHIQAYVKLQKQQRMSFMKKLWTTGHFTPLTNSEYQLNMERYCTKDDETKASATVVQHNEALDTVDSVLKRFCTELAGYWSDRDSWKEFPDYIQREFHDWSGTSSQWETILDKFPRWIGGELAALQREAILERPRIAKLLISPTYCKLVKTYLREIFLGYLINGSDEVPRQEDADDEQAITLECVDNEETEAEDSSEGSTSDSCSESCSDEVSEGEDGD